MKKWIRPYRKALEYWVLNRAVSLGGLLTHRSAQRVSKVLGGLAWLVARSERRTVLDGLARAFPEMSEKERQAIGKQSVQHLVLSIMEWMLKAPLRKKIVENIRVSTEDRASIEQALAEGKGLIFVTGHVGNWEYLAQWLATYQSRLWAVAREIRNPHLKKWIQKMRSDAGVETIWRGDSGSGMSLLRSLRRGHILGMLIDQDTRVPSVHVPFFGHPAKTPVGAASMALRMDAPVVVGFCQRDEDGGFTMRAKRIEVTRTGDDDADALELTAQMTNEIEQAIRRNPVQWVWNHRRWKTPPEAPAEEG